MPVSKKTIYSGPFAHCKSLQELDICTTGAIGVSEQGIIKFVERNFDDAILELHGEDWSDAEIVKIKDDGFFFPGFIDTHIHAPQYPNAGIFGKSTLLDWLNTYTFPTESSLKALPRATQIYNRVVSQTLAHGTTTAAYYATIHVPATNLLADICHARGQRALVGRVCMDSELSPEWYRDEDAAHAIRDTELCIGHIRGLDPTFELVRPVITPRFAPSCSETCLKGLGDLLAREKDCAAQTHVSENKAEIELVKELFPERSSYCDVYDHAGLLTPRTILAHGVHLTDVEKILIKEKGAKISHCPASNTALTSGCARVRQLLDVGIDVGLGTDVSGGFSISVLESVRQAIWVSRFVAMTEGDTAKLSTEEALYLATLGGARVVGLEGKVGSFEVGMQWDAQMISLPRVRDDGLGRTVGGGMVDIFGWETWEDRVAKWVYNGDDRNTAAVWVKGHLVHDIR